MILVAAFPAIPSSVAKIASERRCAILVHSAAHPLRTQPRTKNTTVIVNLLYFRSKFLATAMVKHYGGHFETTSFKGELSSKSLQK